MGFQRICFNLFRHKLKSCNERQNKIEPNANKIETNANKIEPNANKIETNANKIEPNANKMLKQYFYNKQSFHSFPSFKII